MEFIRTIGSGGFADVYLYKQLDLQREVGIKVMRKGLRAAALEAFKQEAAVMARVSAHPQIVTIYGSGLCADGRPYLMMEFCPHAHLGQLISQSPLSLDIALETTIKLAGAVETVHRLGILHQDIKPANVLFTVYNEPALTDFGIASTTQSTGGNDFVSPPWAPPEQILGQEPSPSSDVYSLAATLFTCLAGYSPYRKAGCKDIAALQQRVLRDPVPRINRPDVPETLHRALTTALSKEQQQRSPTALSFLQALQEVQHSLQLPATQPQLDRGRTDTGPLAIVRDDAGETAVGSVQLINPEGESTPTNSGATTNLPPVAQVQSFTPQQNEWGENFENTVVGQHGSPGHELNPNTAARPSQAEPTNTAPAPVVGNTSHTKAIAIGLVLATLTIGGLVAGFIAMKPKSVSSAAEAETPVKKAPVDPFGEIVPKPIDLTGSAGTDGVSFTWKNPSPQTKDTFLYTVSDPEVKQQLRSTEEAVATIAARPGKTCLSVMLRRNNGRTSQPVVACVATP